MVRILVVCGARPNFMKIAPLIDAFRRTGRIETTLVHTGQHYDKRMSELFFRQLGIPEPDINLEVGSGSHAAQTAEIMKRFEPVLLDRRPNWLVVVGDVNSTLACALVASKLGVRVAHVEAGLRSFDRTMPEEINRLLTDAISDALFVSEPSGVENLRAEGVPDERVYFVGNVMIDALLKHRARAAQSNILAELGVKPRQYVAVTLHRPSNVDNAESLTEIVTAFEDIARQCAVVFPMHPRTARKAAQWGLDDRLRRISGMHMPPPLGYLDFLCLMSQAAAVITDSGGIQEETTILGVPCLTLRDNTERPVTITHGTNRLVRAERTAIVDAFTTCRAAGETQRIVPELWDGNAADRIAAILVR
jgi:UDP-N-acetylglucosamine 2-epimerase (non-hydrolysing)